MIRPTVMTEDTYLDHRESYDGYCTRCREFTNLGGVEPDARGYLCESCGQPSVVGAEEALLEGLIAIGGETDGDADYPD